MEDALFIIENGNDDDQLSVGVVRQILAEKDTNLQLAAGLSVLCDFFMFYLF